jgi:hypothetical protein
VNAVLTVCSQRFYLLKVLRDGGMPAGKLNVVFCALIVVNRLSYCLSAWGGGFINVEKIGRLNALLARAIGNIVVLTNFMGL